MISLKERIVNREKIGNACKKLILSQRMVELCESQATPKQEAFLAYVLEQELHKRELNKRARQLSRASFPVLKSFEDYEFGSVRFPPALSQAELLSCRFIAEKKNLILYGPVGIGKTHMAIALVQQILNN